MKHLKQLVLMGSLLAVGACPALPADMRSQNDGEAPSSNGVRTAEPMEKGYYKDIFMDSGVMLTSRYELYAAHYLGLDVEAFVSTNHKTSKNTEADTIMQQMIMGGYAADENGILLYPDGAPRYRMIYVNGGRATRHGRSLGEQGRQRIIDFVKAGGSYVGTCAGMFIACQFLNDSIPEENPEYLHIWPGSACGTGISTKRHGITLAEDSPLLDYYDYGGDLRIDSVYHNGGGYAVTDTLFPVGTQILARYETSNLKNTEKVNGKPAIWSYKASETSGRLVLCGSHPEAECEGERLQLMSALLRHAMDGNAPLQVKGSLQLGQKRSMTRSTHDAMPEYTKIGDHQYHHFTLDVPEGLDSLIIDLSAGKGWDGYDLYLTAHPGAPAWLGSARYVDVGSGAVKTLRIAHPEPGPWYIAVYGASTVTAKETDKGTRYIDHLDVLNGIPYILGVNLPKE